MPTETLIERAYTLVQLNRTSEVRPVLAQLFRANANDAEAWALAAEIAPTLETREQALRKVTDLSADNRLAEWAITELSRMKGIPVNVKRMAPPLPSVPDSWEGTAVIDIWSHAPSTSPHRDAVELPPIAPAPPSPSRDVTDLVVDESGNIKGLAKPVNAIKEGTSLNLGEIALIVAGISGVLGIAMFVAWLVGSDGRLFGSNLAVLFAARSLCLSSAGLVFATFTIRICLWFYRQIK